MDGMLTEKQPSKDHGGHCGGDNDANNCLRAVIARVCCGRGGLRSRGDGSG